MAKRRPNRCIIGDAMLPEIGEKWPKMRLGILRFAMAPSDAAEKDRNIGAQKPQRCLGKLTLFHILPLLHCLWWFGFKLPAGCSVFTHCVKISIVAPEGKTLRRIEKWFTPFRIVTTSSVTMQTAKFEEIKLRAPSVGGKIWCFLFFTLGMPARGGRSLNK